MESLVSLMDQLAVTGDENRRDTRDHNVFGGMDAVRAVIRLQGMGAGAAQNFAGGFGGLGQAALQASAFQRAGSPLQALNLMQQMAEDPREVRRVLLDMLPTEGAQLAMAGGGFSAEQADVLSRQLEGGAGGRFRHADADAFPISGMMAEHARELLEIEARTPGTTDMLEAIHLVNETLLGMGDETADFLAKIVSILRGGSWFDT